MTQLVSKPDHGTPIGYIDKDTDKPIFPSPMMQLYMDDITEKMNGFLLGNSILMSSYTVLTLPPVPSVDNPGLIYVSDEVGGAVPAFSDGTNWLRVTDRVIVS